MAMLNSFGSGVQISQEWLQVDMLLVSGRKRIIEGSEQDQMRKEKKKIKNRASAARSRQKKIMEEEEKKVEETANRPSSLKRTLSALW
ncbi:hypothetical protein JCGZ_13572 [Jatropha curcas]|uniref:BZIP domain-containing protein n=1 Tax=Jatropha curcas TaxID=180498 RepID=A0A067KLI8_JATCU|nr:hypothetical protein JCGZ_13572 [Jatropha curcas]